MAVATIRAFNRYGVRNSVPRDVVDDLLQQAFIRLCSDDYRVFRQLENEIDEGILAYVRTISTNLAIDFLRSSRAPTAELDPETLTDDRPGVLTQLMVGSIEKHVARCSANNPSRDQSVFWLHFRSGLTFKAIAGLPAVGLSESGVESLILRLIRCVRKILAEGNRGVRTFQKEGRSFGAAS